MKFRTCLWHALRVKLLVFTAGSLLAVTYFQIGGVGHLPNERPHDPDSVCLTLPSFYANGACDSDPNT